MSKANRVAIKRLEKAFLTFVDELNGEWKKYVGLLISVARETQNITKFLEANNNYVRLADQPENQPQGQVSETWVDVPEGEQPSSQPEIKAEINQ